MDKFKGTLSARDAAQSVYRAAGDHWCDACPVGDGGDGTIEAFGRPNRVSRVVGPHGHGLDADWLLDGDTAYIEMAAASGLVVSNDRHHPVEATTYGTGQLIAEAIRLGAGRILVGVGGSATTDGGAGAIQAVTPLLEDGRLPVPVTVLCDVSTIFTDAASIFATQKGASPAQVELLTERLRSIRTGWLDRFDVDEIAGSGAGGGLAGGLASLGADLKPGFSMVAEHLDLARRITEVDLIFTGEGRFDETSRQGKAVGGVLSLAANAGVQTMVIAGTASEAGPNVISLVDRYGEAAWNDPAACIEAAVREVLDGPAITSR